MIGQGGGGFGGNGFGGGGFGGRNATPEAEESLAKILRSINTIPDNYSYNNNGTQTSGQPDLTWFLKAIQGAEPVNDGLPHGTQRSGADAQQAGLYTIKLLGSGMLGYPQTGAFNAPNPKGLLTPNSPNNQTQTQEIKELME